MLSTPPPPDLARQKGVLAVPRFRALRFYTWPPNTLETAPLALDGTHQPSTA